LLDLQVQVSLRKLSGGSPVAEHLRVVYDRCNAIRRDPACLKDVFWSSFKRSSTTAFTRVTSDVDSTALAATFDELIAYREFARQVGWNQEEGKIIEKVVGLVGQQVKFVLERESEWSINGAALARRRTSSHHNHNYYGDECSFPWDWEHDANGWYNIYTRQRRASTKNPGEVELTWKSLTYHDWATIIGSLLLTASSRHFCERFGCEKMLLERILQRHTFYSNCLTSGKTTAEINALENIPVFSKGKYVNGKFVPNDPVKYSVVAQVAAPELISDPSHWGHVIWKFGMFMDRQENQVAH
jgi:hypothetical protein